MKSGWPGVSIRLTVTSPTANEATADLIVMPRRRSSAERVGLGAAVVDAAELVDDAGRVQQPFGEAGLTGVDVRQDAEVQGLHMRFMSFMWMAMVGSDMRVALLRCLSFGSVLR